VYGITDPARLDERTPTFAVRVGGRDPVETCRALAERGIFTWDGHYYAIEIFERLGLLADGGAVRIGFCHYHTPDEVDRVLPPEQRVTAFTLYRLAVNHCLDVLRGRQTKMQRSTDSLDEEGAIEPAAAMPVVPTAISRLDLDRAIARLPEGCRAAFVLHDVEGLEHHEVASLLGISQGTSKSQVHKARMRIRGFLHQTRTATAARATNGR